MKETNTVIISPVIRIAGDFDKIKNFALANLKAAIAYKGVIPFFEQLGVTIYVEETNALPTFHSSIRHYKTFKTRGGAIFVRNIPILGKAFICIEDIQTTSPVLKWNNLFRWWSNFRCSRIGSLGYHVESVITLKLLELDMTLVHGSCVSLDDFAVLFTGLPNQGKTSTVIELIEDGGGFLSEDICILSRSGAVFSLPFTTSFKDAKGKAKHKKVLLEIVPVKIEPLARLKKIVVLERGFKNSVMQLSTEQAVQKICLINHLEFSYHKNILLRKYLALHSGQPIHRFMILEEEIIKDVVRSTEVYLLSFTDHIARRRMVEEVLE